MALQRTAAARAAASSFSVWALAKGIHSPCGNAAGALVYSGVRMISQLLSHLFNSPTAKSTDYSESAAFRANGIWIAQSFIFLLPLWSYLQPEFQQANDHYHDQYRSVHNSAQVECSGKRGKTHSILPVEYRIRFDMKPDDTSVLSGFLFWKLVYNFFFL